MEKRYKITILDYNEVGKVHAIKAIKDHLNIGLKEAKDWVESLPQLLDGEYNLEQVHWFQDRFSCEISDGIETDSVSLYFPIVKPDEETKIALAWYETQPKHIQEMINIVGKWNNPQLIACG